MIASQLDDMEEKELNILRNTQQEDVDFDRLEELLNKENTN